MQFEKIYNSLAKNLEDILAHGREHVIVKLAEGCLQFGTKQEKIIKVYATFVIVIFSLEISGNG